MEDISWSPTLSTYVRTGTHDIIIAREARSYPLNPVNEEVLDVGACFGAFTRWAVARGAKWVTAVEPNPACYQLLEPNVSTLPNVTVLKQAVVTGSATPTTLHLPADDFNLGLGTLYLEPLLDEHVGNPKLENFTRTVEVSTVDWQKLLQQVKPGVIKIDVEGAEYNFLDGTTLPQCVRQVAVELHLHRIGWRALADRVIQSFKHWHPVRDLTIKPGLLSITLAWQRSVSY